MQLENQVCSLELAKELKKLGVKQESQFYWNRGQSYLICEDSRLRVPEDVSAFTVAELGEVLPEVTAIQNGELGRLEITYRTYSEDGNREWDVCYMANNDFRSEFANTEADARAKMLIYLLENKLITLETAKN